MAKLTTDGIIDLYRGDTEDLVLTWFDVDDEGAETPIDLSLYSRIDFQVRPGVGAKKIYINRSTDDSTITISGVDSNVLTITLPPAVTEILKPTKKGWYADLQFTASDGTVTTYPADRDYWRVPVIADITQI